VWLVALLVFVLVTGGLGGAIVVTNQISTSQYAARVAAGEGIGSLVIPRLGDTAVPILPGTNPESLRAGVGWYESGALPGAIGNCAIAGHRLGWGQPFAHLDTLQAGDEVRVTTPEATYTYKIITPPTVVSGDETDVLAAVPGEPGRTPTKALITLTTAASWLPSPNRLVVVGELA